MSATRSAVRLASLALLVLAATRGAAQTPTLPPATSLVPLRVVDPAWIDTTTSACVDFFQYANGAWLSHDTIPAACASSGVGRDMSDRNELVVRAVLDDAAARRATLPPASTLRKLGTFYATCMDSTAIETAGARPIMPLLAGIDSVTSAAGVVARIATLQVRGIDVAFRYSPDVDPHDAAHYVTWLSQGGLGLPDRDYYTNTGPAADSLRRQYVDHLARLFTLAGQPATAAAGDAAQVIALETELAKASLTRVQRRDPAATDHPLPIAELRALAPAVDWTAYFRGIGLTAPVTRLNAAEPDFLARVSALLQTTPPAAWRAYLRARVLAAAAPWLSAPFVQEDFAFRSRFTGARELLPRWKRCLRETDGDLGEALGEAYVAKTFPPEARARARAVIDDVRAAFRERVQHLTWMSDSTRAQALDKLARLGGSWAGHELTHGFDDEGRHYDAAGNLRDWWTAADSAHFTEQAELVVQQFAGYIQVDTFHVNGRLTLGENIADYGGVLTGYDALERALQRDGRPGLIDGYTPEQRYFLAYAQSWRDHTRDASLRTRVMVDPHAPERWRANGPLSNTPAFARAFGCKPGDPMVRPPERVPQIW